MEALASSSELSQSQLDQLNQLRSQLPDAMVNTYVYAPLVGLIHQTDPNGLTTKYEYDGLGRLKVVRDNINNILKTYEYNYAGQR